MRQWTLMLIALLCLAWNPALLAEEWWQFRGPTGQGHSAEKNLPISWSTTENVAWQVEIPGEGWSSPVHSRGRIYLTTAVPQTTGAANDYSLRALCLEERSGKLVWDVEVFLQKGAASPRIHDKNSHASPTPIVADDRLYVHFGHQGTACLDLKGSIVWRNDQLRYNPVHGNGGSPAIVDDLLVFSCDGAENPIIVALDRKNGEIRWRTDRPSDADKKFSFSTPLVIEVSGKKQIISPGSNVVCAYDPKSGQEIWRVRYDGYSVIPRPVFGHGMIYISTGYNQPELLAIRVNGSGDVTDTHIAWRISDGAPHAPSPLLVGNELYFVSDSGIVTCADALTGEEIYRQRLDGNYSASPIYASSRLYFQNETGVGTVVEAGRTFKELAANNLNEPTLASYCVSDSALIIRTQSRLYKIAQ